MQSLANKVISALTVASSLTADITTTQAQTTTMQPFLDCQATLGQYLED